MSVEDILKWAKDLAWDITSGIKETIQDIDIPFVDVKEIVSFWSKIPERFKSIKTDYQASLLWAKKEELNDDDKKHIETIKQETWGIMIQDLVKWVDKMWWMWDKVDKFWDWTGLYDLGWPKYKKWVDRDLFNQNLDEKRALLNEKINQLDKIRLEWITNNNLQVLNNFLASAETYKMQWYSEDEAQAKARSEFTSWELKKLQSEFKTYNEKVLPEITKLEIESSELYKDSKRIIEDWVEIEDQEKFDELLQPTFRWSLKVSSELMQKNRDELDLILKPVLTDKQSNQMIWDKYDKLIELHTNLDVQRLKRLSEADPEDYNEINSEYTTINNAMKKFYTEQFKSELSIRSKDSNWKDDDTIEFEAINKAYSKLSVEEQERVRSKKIFDNVQAISVNSKQMKDNIKDWNYLKWIYNAVETIFSTTWLALNYWVTAAWEPWEWESFNIRRLWQSIMNADNTTVKEIVKWIMYNPWDVLNFALSLWGWNAAVAWWKNLSHLTKALATGYTPKYIKWIIWGKPAQFLINNKLTQWWIKLAWYWAEWIVTWIWPNTAIDLWMWEVSTKALDEFNLLTDIFFDTAFIPWAKWLYKITKHDLLSDLMFWETKASRDSAVTTFNTYLNESFKWTKTFTEKETKELLRDQVIPLYRTTIDTSVSDKIFNKWEIYWYVTDVLKQMETDKLKTLLTPDGHIIKLEWNPFQKISNDLNNIFDLNLKLPTLKWKEKDLYTTALDKRISELDSWVTWNNSLFGNKLTNVPENKINEFRETIQNIKKSTSKTTEEQNDDLLNKITALIDSYSNSKNEQIISITNALSWAKMSMKLKDLEEIAKLEWKTTQQIINEWYVNISKESAELTKYKKWVYEIRKTSVWFVLWQEDKFYNDALDYIDWLIKDWKYTPKLKEDWTEVLSNKELAYELASEAIQLITGRTYKLDLKTWIRKESSQWIISNVFNKRIWNTWWSIELDKDFLLSKIKEILWEDNVVELHIWDWLVPIKEVIERTANKDALFVFTYWTFESIVEKNKWEKLYAKYLMPWKQIFDSKMEWNFREITTIKQWKQKSEWLSAYTNRVVKSIRQMISYSKIIDWKLNIQWWIEIFDAIESHNIYWDIISADWTINAFPIDQIIKDAINLSGKWKWDLTRREIKDLVLSFINKFDKDDNDFLWTVVKNLAYKMISNSELIKKLMKGWNIEQRNFYLKQILVSDKQLKELSNKFWIKWDTDKMYNAMLDVEYNKFVIKNKFVEEELEWNIKWIKDMLKTYKATSQFRTKLQEEHKSLEKKLTLIKANNKMSFEDFSNKYKNQLEVRWRFIKMDTALDKALWVSDEWLRTYEEFLNTRDKLTKELSTLNVQEKEIVLNVSKEKIVNWTDIQWVDPKLQSISEDLNKIMNSKFRNTEAFSEDRLIAELESSMNLWVWVYKKEYALQNNKLKAFINNSMSNDSMFAGWENILLNAFKWLYKSDLNEWINNFNDLFEKNEWFKAFVKWLLYSSEEVDWKLMIIGKSKMKDFYDTLWNILDDLFKEKWITALEWTKLVDIYSDLKKDLFETDKWKLKWEIYMKFKSLNYRKKYTNKVKKNKNKDIYKWLNIIYRNDIVNKVWELWAIQINTATKTISINKELMLDKFNKQAWTNPYVLKDWTKATALEKDFFKTYEDFEKFLLEHEYQHTIIKIKEWQSLWEYEDIINNEAIKQLQKESKELIKDTEDILNLSVKKNDEWFNELQYDKWYYADKTLIIDEAIEKFWEDIWFIKIDDISSVRYIKIDEYKSLWTLFNNEIKEWVYKKIDWELQEIWSYNISDVDKANIIFKAAWWDYNTWFYNAKWKQIFNFSKHRGVIRKSLWLKEWEEITWTFWDKDTFLIKYNFWDSKKSFDTKQREYWELYFDKMWFKQKWKVLSANKWTKRESALMSNNSTFDNVDLKLWAFILDEVHEWVEWLVEKIDWEWQIVWKYNSDELLFTIGKLDNYIKNPELFDDIKWQIDATEWELGKIKVLEWIILKDLEDGTSFVTQDVTRLRNSINWLWDELNSFKDHLWWDVKWEKFLAKTLFNPAKWKVTRMFNWEESIISNAVFIWASSLKLKWWFAKKNLWQVVINWKTYNIIWEIDWVSTQNFKNASSDSFKEAEEQSVALQVINNLPQEHQDAMFDIIKSDIDEAYIELIENKVNDKWSPRDWFKSTQEQDIEDIVSYYASHWSDIWEWHDSILSWYIWSFLWAASKIINKWKTPWQTAFMQEASLYLKSNEIVLSINNTMIKNIIKDIETKMLDLDKESLEFLELERKLKDNDFEIVWYRYPVATNYNLWTYKILIAEDLHKKEWNRFRKLNRRYKDIPAWNTVMSPYAVFVKKEWDFDWDHLYMISAHSKKWDVLSRASLWLWMKDDIYEAFKNPINKHLVTEQAEWWDVSVSLFDARLISLNAKKNVWTVVSWKRTLQLLRQVANDHISLSEDLQKENLNKVIWASWFKNEDFDKDTYREFTVWDIVNLMTWSYSSKEFDEIAASQIQVAIDFAKAGKLEFPHDWFDKMAIPAWVPKENLKQFLDIASWISFWYKTWDDLKIPDLHKINKQEYLLNKIWIKWDLYEHVIDTYFDKLKIINQTNDIEFIISRFNTSDPVMKWIIDEINELYYFTKDWKQIKGNFLPSANRFKISEIIESKKLWWFFKELTNEYESLILEDWLKPLKAVKEIILKHKELFSTENTTTRQLFALYTLWFWNYKSFDLLTAKEKIDFIKYADEKNRQKITRRWAGEILTDGKTIIKPQTEIQIKSEIEVLKDQLEIIKNEEWFLDKEVNLAFVNKKIAEFEDQLRKQEDIKRIVAEESNSNKVELSEEFKAVSEPFDYTPITTFEDLSFDKITEIIWTNNKYSTDRNRFSKLMISDYLEKYDMQLLIRINTTSNMVNEEINWINWITLWRLNKDFTNNFWKIIKTNFNFSLDNFKLFKKELDLTLIKRIQWKKWEYYIKDDMIDITNELTEKFKNKITWETHNFMWNELFIETLNWYINSVTKPILEISNRLENESLWSINQIDIADIYLKWSQWTTTLFEDILWASKSDWSFALRTMWIWTGTESIVQRLVSKWMPERNARKIATLFVPRQWVIEKAISYINAFHYLSNYWLLGNLFWQKWIIMATAQLIPNTFQLLSTIALHKKWLWDAELFIKKYKLMWNDDMVNLSLWHDLEVSQNWIITGLSNILLAWINNVWKWVWKDFNNFAKYIESAVMSPLSFWDMPLEAMRKHAWLIQFYRSLWLNSTEELEQWMSKRINTDWFTEFDIKWFINNWISKNYANSGWWVVSSSQLYRKTFMNTFALWQWDSSLYMLPRIFYGLVWYLNWWAFNLTSQVIDNQLKFVDAGKYLIRWDIKQSSQFMEDWLAYNWTLFYMSANAAAVYLKMEKYERDPNDIWSIEDFTNSFNNTMVALEILFWQTFDRMWVADRLWWTVWEATWYSVAWLFERYLRTIVYPVKVWASIYDEYRTSLKMDNYETHSMNSIIKFTDIVQRAFTANVDSYLRYNGQKAMEDNFKTITDWSNVAWFLLGWNTVEDDILEKAINNKNFIWYLDKWFWVALSNIFWKAFSLENWKYNITSERARAIADQLQNREWISQLLKNQWITSNLDIEWYQLSRILWDNKSFTYDQQTSTKELWNEIIYKYSDELDLEWKNLFNFWEITWLNAWLETTRIDDMVTSVLRDKMALAWLDIDTVINWDSPDWNWFLKLMALVEHVPEISAGQMLAYMFQRQYNNETYEFKKNNLEKGKDWFYHMEDEDESFFKRKVLLKNADYLNLDADTVMKVSELEIKNNQKDIYNNFKKDSEWKHDWRDQTILNEMNSILALQYISTKELQRWDTSITSLQSRYSTLLKWLDLTDDRWIKIVNDLLIDIQNSPQDPKSKTTKKAALIMWLNKAAYWVLEKDEKFNLLSNSSKKTIANWIYDTSTKAVDYDADKIMNDILNSNSSTWSSKKYYPNKIFNNWKSKNFNDARPWFNKQFAPMQKFIPKVLPYISKNPQWYISQISQGRPQTFNFYKSPVMEEFFKVKAEVFMNELYSKWVIKAWWTKQELAKQKKRTIILKPKRKVKNPKNRLLPVRVPKTSKWLLSDKPFNYE